MKMKLSGIVMFVEINMGHKVGLFIALNAIMIYAIIVLKMQKNKISI